MVRGRGWLVGAALAVAATVIPDGAHANLRAPRVEPQQPSSALRPLGPVPEVVVLGETLSFRCGPTICDVDARYRVTATRAVTARLAFVLPAATPIGVQVGGGAVLVEVAAASPAAVGDLRLAETDAGAVRGPALPIFEARFEADFAPGENTIAITYQQPLGRSELDYGYFKKGRFVQVFRYELWPVSEWKHAPGFQVAVVVSLRRAPPSWWQRTFSRVQSVGCRGDAPLGAAVLQQCGDVLELSFALSDPLPQRLWCEVGDSDLVPNP